MINNNNLFNEKKTVFFSLTIFDRSTKVSKHENWFNYNIRVRRPTIKKCWMKISFRIIIMHTPRRRRTCMPYPYYTHTSNINR